MNMEITAFYEPESFTWTYLLADRSSGKAAIIDPVWVYDPVSGMANTAHTDEILKVVEDNGMVLEWILETHTHADHLSSAGYIRNATGAKLAIGHGVHEVQKTFVKIFNLDNVPTDGSQFDRLLFNGDVITLGSLDVRVMETPGHTNDSMTYVCGDVAFIGDTLFAPDYGTARCDFPGGDAALLFDSIARIHALPAQTRLHLCHDYPSKEATPRSVVTVAESLAQNIHARAGTSRESYVEMRTTRDAQLSLPRLIFASIQVNIRGGEAPATDRNGVS
ncbi:MAG: glyoxylase-like metal-dependent hydrolase (beta-lactamase superfamily II), partial [Lysobacterales bacterium]